MPDRVLVGMSGGVDSTMTVLLLREQGFEVLGANMQLFDRDVLPEGVPTCGAMDGAEDARRAAELLGIPFYALDFREEFRREVLDRFAKGYRRGQTPNPCAECNRFLKFGRLVQAAQSLGADCLATGHYARRVRSGERWLLKKGRDESRDQSYFLCRLTQEQLTHAMFPLGELTKAEVRERAAAHGLFNAAKRDSQDICFVPDGDYGAFLERYAGVPSVPGDYVNAAGEVLGRHLGQEHYTVGQRRGLGLSMGHRVYVTGRDAERNLVFIGENADLFSPELEAEALNWQAFDRLSSPIRCEVKIRNSLFDIAATAEQTGPETLTVRFDSPQRAVTPGQTVAIYDGDTVLGGAVIVRALS